MPNIKLVDDSSLDIESKLITPALTHYLHGGLVFVFHNLSPEFKQAQNKPIGEIDAGSFPATLTASIPGSFAISSATLVIQPGGGASIDLLKNDKKADFLKALREDPATTPDLICFDVTTELQSGPSGTVGDFCFGLVSGQEVWVSNYCPVRANDLFQDALRGAISGLTLPHDLDDLRWLPEGNVCRIRGKGSLKFTASVQYNFLNNTLATAPIEILSNSLSIKAQSGPMFSVAVEHSDTHQLTIAALGANKVRVGVSLAAEAGTGEAFDFSVGISGNIGNHDALQFLVEQISKTPDTDLQQIRSVLGAGEQSDLSSQIKTVVQGATKGGISVSLHDAFKQSRERNHLFVYDVDLNGLDSTSTVAWESALKGDFRQITALGSSLAGVTEVSSFSTLTLTRTHTLNIHLLGILNFSNVASFMKKSKIALSGETSEVVLAATDIKIAQNTVDPDHLREVLTKSAMITTAAAGSAKNADFTFRMGFFLKKAGAHASDLRQMYNTLAFVNCPDAAVAKGLLTPATLNPPDAFLYLALELNQKLSRAIFDSKTTDDFVTAGQQALKAILADDAASAERSKLLSVDLNFWRQLRTAGAAAGIQRLLADRGMNEAASVVDFLSIDWWAQAMGKMGSALATGNNLLDAERDVLRNSQGGFNEPWALLATGIAAGNPRIEARFAVSGGRPAAATAMAG